MALSTTQYGYIIDPMVPFTDDKGKTIKNGFVRVFVAGSSTPVITYRNFDGAANQDLIELDNSGRTRTSVIGSKGLTYKVCVYDAFHSQESPILTVDKVSAIGANITAGSGATVVTGLDGLTTKPDGFVDASVVGTDGYVALDHTLVTDDLDTDAKVSAVEDDRYIPLLNEKVNDPDSKMTLGRMWQWVLGKIKNLSTTITAFRTGDVIPVDGPSGTAKMSNDDLLRVTANNALKDLDIEFGFFSSQTTAGSDFSQWVKLTGNAGEKIIYKFSATSGVVDSGGFNIVCYDSDGNSVQSFTTNTFEKYLVFVASGDFEKILVRRSGSGVIGSGNVKFFAISERTFRDYLEDRLLSIEDVCGNLQNVEVVSGAGFHKYIKTTITKNVPFSLSIFADGLFNTNSLRLYFEDDEGNSLFIGYLNVLDGKRVNYYPSANYTKIHLYVGNSDVIASGNMKVFVYPSESPVDMDSELGNVVYLQVKSGSTFNQYVKADIKKDIPLYIKVSGSGLFSTTSLNVYFEDDAGNSQHPSNLNRFNEVFEYLPNANYTKIRLNRSSSGVVGNGLLQVTLYPSGIAGQQIQLLRRDEVYVSNSGLDTNIGTKDLPKKTISAALSEGASVINLLEGVYDTNTIDFSISPRNKITLKGEIGKKIIFKKASSLIANDGSEQLEAGTTKVYSVACSAISYSSGTKWLFFDDCPEVGTAITPEEAHPLERGKFYRLDCTRSNHTTATTKSDAITEIEACGANEYKWYYDSGEGKVYFNRPDSTSVYPLYKSGVSYITTRNGQSLELRNIEFRYGHVTLLNLNGALIVDCASKYAYGAGAWNYKDSIGVEFIRCEACCAFSGTTGDGFNAHATEGSSLDAKYNTCILRECWSHDNNDDGYSDHEFAETTIDGGLFEYNGKGGVVPAFGCSCIVKNAMSRNNYNGFYYLGDKNDHGNEGQMICYNCVSVNNGNNSDAYSAGFRVFDGNNKMILVGCHSVNDKNGYSGESGCYVEMYNCTCVNPTSNVKTGSATFVIDNGNLVE